MFERFLHGALLSLVRLHTSQFVKCVEKKHRASLNQVLVLERDDVVPNDQVLRSLNLKH